MSDMTGSDFEVDLQRRLRRYARIDVRPIDAASVAHDAHRLGARRGVRGSWPWSMPRSGRRLALVFGLVALAIAAVAVAIVGQQPSTLRDPALGRNGVIGFVEHMETTGDGRLHLVAPDGTDDRVVGAGRWFRFSGDGSTMAYQTGSRGARRLVVAGADGSGARIVEGFDPGRPDFVLARDGRYVLVGVDEGDSGVALVTIDVASGRSRRLVPAPFDSYWSLKHGALSPDGAWFAYPVSDGDLDRWDALQSMGPFTIGIDLVRVATGEVRRLASLVGQPAPLAWTPDSRSVSVMAWVDQVVEPMPSSLSGWSYTHEPALYSVDIGDGAIRILSTDPPPCGRMTWAPAGDAIACVTDTDEGVAVAIIPIDAAGVAGHASVGPLADDVVWAPDGSGLLLASPTSPEPPDGGVRPGSEIRLIDRTLSGPRTIATVEGAIDSLAWQWLAP